jgi:Uma2 family endonuclease
MASTPTRLMTFAEFEQLPDPKFGHYELHHGELVEVAPPKHKHHRVQDQLVYLLIEPARTAGRVTMELGFRPVPDLEYWEADFAFISHTRYDQTPREGTFSGAPELVTEVLSPSNTAAEIRTKRKLCLENGSVEFWVADADQREIEVWTPDGRSVTYRAGERIPLFFAPGSFVSVDAIFE